MVTRLLKCGVCLAALVSWGYLAQESEAQRRGRDRIIFRFGDGRMVSERDYRAPQERLTTAAATSITASSIRDEESGFEESDATVPPKAHIRVRIPDHRGELWFDGAATKQQGLERFFVTPPLTGNGFYQVRASWTDEQGRWMDQIRDVAVEPGAEAFVDFSVP